MPILLAAWSLLKKIPPLYLALALLGLALWLEHTRLVWCQQERQSISNSLRTAVDANQADASTIAAQRAALADLTGKLDQERADAAAAAAKAVQRDQVLQQRLAADRQILGRLGRDPRYAPFLQIDIDAQYPDVAQWLRNADRGQD